MVDTCPICKLKVTSILHSATSTVEYQEITHSGNSETGKHRLCQGVILEMFNLMERKKLDLAKYDGMIKVLLWGKFSCILCEFS